MRFLPLGRPLGLKMRLRRGEFFSDRSREEEKNEVEEKKKGCLVFFFFFPYVLPFPLKESVS